MIRIISNISFYAKLILEFNMKLIPEEISELYRIREILRDIVEKYIPEDKRKEYLS